MSAVLGLLRLAGPSIESQELDPMSRALAAHGPDAVGVWSDRHIALGHRLMRVTPEDRFDHQPLNDVNSGLALVWDGRLDNREELAAELGISTSELPTLPDSAVALRACLRWGESCAGHLVGVFAFAVWNARERRLMLARSPLAARPLFYSVIGDTVAFATAPRGLCALPSVRRALDEEHLADYLAYERARSGATFYRGISRVMPGETVVVAHTGLSVHSRWAFTPRPELRLARDEDYVEAFDTLFTRVVRDHLRSERQVGILLSGGLDSSSVASVAAPILEKDGRRLFGFTEVPRAGFDGPLMPGRYGDERPFVMALARQYGNLAPAFVDTTGGFLLDDLSGMFEALERPFHRPTNRVWYEAALREAGRQDVGVMLHGTSGNLTMSWSGDGLLPGLCRNFRWLDAWRESRASARQASSSTLRVLAGGVLPLLPFDVYLAIGRLRSGDDVGWSRHPWRAFSAINPAFARRHRVSERAREMGPDLRLSVRPEDGAAQRAFAVARYADVTDGNDAGHQAMFGTDIRDPTGDLRLVEFCLSVPESQYRRNGESRWLIRRAMRSRLPQEILASRARGFQAADWFERMTHASDRIDAELAALERSPLAREAIDIAHLRRLAASLGPTAAMTQTMMNDYRGTLESGLMVGRFIRWVEDSGAAAP